MNRRLKQLKILFLSCILSLSLSACMQDNQAPPSGTEAAALPEGTAPAVETGTPDAAEADSNSSTCYGSSHSGRYGWQWSNSHYTQEDYNLVMSFRTDGYQDQTVAEFDQRVLDWKDEASYHKMEETLRRLYSGLSREDKNADFIFGTLSNTWNACQKKHYDTCAREKNPWYEGYSEYETFGDVYGDQVCLTSAIADFDFDYRIADENAITVGERDAILNSIAEKLTEYMRGQPAEKLRDEDAMEKTLQAELEKSLEALEGGSLSWAGSCGLSYWWEAPWETECYEDEEEEQDEEKEETPPEGYTQEQYAQVLERLQYDRHKDMSIAEFDRMINALFTGNEINQQDLENFYQTFEIVSAYIDENDPASTFLCDTVPNALNEYEARARTVYTGRQVDPTYNDQLSLSHTEDVFGDQIPVEFLEADYTLTYRILDADALTVGQRDAFLADIKSGAKDILAEAMKEGEVNESSLQRALLEAGKKAETSSISLTGCEVDYLYTYQ